MLKRFSPIMHGLPARFIFGFLAVSFPLTIADLSIAQEETSQPLTYELTIDGHSFEIKDSKPTEIDLQNGSSKSTATIKVKDVQSYSTNAFTFDYERNFSLKDDHDSSSRTITLIRADGTSIVITDQNRPDGNEGKSLAEYLQSSMEDRYRAGVVKKLDKLPAKSVVYKAKKGHMAAIQYVDEDDDELLCKIYVLQDDLKRYSVIVQGNKEDAARSQSLAEITLNSLSSIR
jgi:hypothetical protein